MLYFFMVAHKAACQKDRFGCLKILLPVILNIQMSLISGKVTKPLKCAVIKPLLEKPGLDSNLPKPYRPVSNLLYTSKLLERVAAAPLVEHNLLRRFQSAYRPGHSTETAAFSRTQ